MKKKSHKRSAEGEKVSDQIFLVHRKTSRDVELSHIGSVKGQKYQTKKTLIHH